MKEDRLELEEIINSRLDCPNCNNEGFTVVQTRSQERVTRDMASDAGDLSLEGSDYGQDEFEQEQCEFCYTQENSKFNLAQAIRAEIKRLIPEEKDIQLTSHKGCLNTKDYEKGHNNCVKIIKGRLM